MPSNKITTRSGRYVCDRVCLHLCVLRCLSARLAVGVSNVVTSPCVTVTTIAVPTPASESGTHDSSEPCQQPFSKCYPSLGLNLDGRNAARVGGGGIQGSDGFSWSAGILWRVAPPARAFITQTHVHTHTRTHTHRHPLNHPSLLAAHTYTHSKDDSKRKCGVFGCCMCVGTECARQPRLAAYSSRSSLGYVSEKGKSFCRKIFRSTQQRTCKHTLEQTQGIYRKKG